MTGPRFVLAAGTTETARVDGISAAGADQSVILHTPSADAEILSYGQTIRAPVAPVSPTGCPSPAAVTRAVRELRPFPLTVVDAGLAEPSGAPTVTVGAQPGEDIRESDPVPTAPGAYRAARELGASLPDDHLVVGASIPGGTTTALAVLTALDAGDAVSSSFPENPLARKREIVAAALADSPLGDPADDPIAVLRHVGDPVLAVVSGVVAGALDAGTQITLAGGSQMLAVAAVLRERGYDDPLDLATTSFLAADDSLELSGTAAELDLDLTVTDPDFDRAHVATARFLDGEATEGVGMGGALALADRAGVLADVPAAVVDVYDRLTQV